MAVKKSEVCEKRGSGEFQFSEPDGGDWQGEVLDGVGEDGLCVLEEVETTV